MNEWLIMIVNGDICWQETVDIDWLTDVHTEAEIHLYFPGRTSPQMSSNVHNRDTNQPDSRSMMVQGVQWVGNRGSFYCLIGKIGAFAKFVIRGKWQLSWFKNGGYVGIVRDYNVGWVYRIYKLRGRLWVWANLSAHVISSIRCTWFWFSNSLKGIHPFSLEMDLSSPIYD